MFRILKMLSGTWLAVALVGGHAAAGTGMPTPAIVLAPAPQGEAWRVGYRLAEPAAALRFARVDARGNRMRDWTVVDA